MSAQPVVPDPQMEHIKQVFREGSQPGNFYTGLAAVAKDAAEDADIGIRETILEKLDDLIWRRKLHEKPYDQLEEIKDMVQQL